MKTQAMTRMAGCVLVTAALAVTANGAEAGAKKRPLKKSDAIQTAAPARLTTAGVWDPVRYPEEGLRRPLNSGQRTLWDVVRAVGAATLATAPLL